jgi:hypothetical protein
VEGTLTLYTAVAAAAGKKAKNEEEEVAEEGAEVKTVEE